MDEQEKQRIIREVRGKAKRRVAKKVGFMWHLAVFVMAQLAMWQINMTYSPDTQWFVWPLCGWGAALLLHAFATFQGGGMTEQMIEAEIERELRARGLS
jgi:hypothetical protein